VAVTYYEEGRLEPGGFIHLTCGPTYFETDDLLPRLPAFSDLSEGDLADIARTLDTAP